ncbi:MAG: carboxypeptidase-like regulatory domain-containing protein [Butyribacter sp.]|nr:carboxypeptidase-like regulatory domain-containing protein [Butyribacter sp.]
MYSLKAAQDFPDTGYFRANITSEVDNRPIEGASIQISHIDTPDTILEEITTDSSGQSETIELPAPPLEYSLEPLSNQPYSEYNIRIEAPGYESLDISGAEILSGETALQNTAMLPLAYSDTEQLFVIPAHTLYGEYPPKIPEDEIKPITQTGEIVLSRVVIPEYVIVHNGPPNDASAKDYYVKYKDYIKNKFVYSLILRHCIRFQFLYYTIYYTISNNRRENMFNTFHLLNLFISSRMHIFIHCHGYI